MWSNLMISNIRYYILFLGLIAAVRASSQGGDTVVDLKNFKPDFGRQLFHDYIDKEQKAVLKSDGRNDTSFHISSNEEVNFLSTQALIYDVDLLQYKIEKDTLLNHQGKVRYLRGLEFMLRYFSSAWASREVNPANLSTIVHGYEECMNRDIAHESIYDLIHTMDYDVGKTIISADVFNNNPGYKDCQYDLIRKYCGLHPSETFATLRQNMDVPFRDSLIKVAGYKYPRLLYDYASAGNSLAFAIRKIDEPFVHTIVRMATARGSGQIYFPFLDNLYQGKLSFEDIDAVKDDSIAYYKLLVKTRLDYVDRIQNKEKIYGLDVLNERLEKKAETVFVNVINGLHEQTDAVRFRIIQQLSAEELYYLAVLTDGIIYTSSYTHGVYPLMMSKIGQRGDSLLMRVKFDKYRKFIKMAAGYNTLNNFLSTFPSPEDAQTLMTAFINRLEESKGLEDGVDVADSYASIAESNREVARQMLENVKLNYQANFEQNNKRGIAIYNILNKLFLSSDSTNNIDLSKELGIPPVYSVGYNYLANDSGKVIMQVFFYGDKDGKMNYNGFLPQFNNANWVKTEDTKSWIAFSSTKGKQIVIYANKWVPEENGELDRAQEALDSYLQEKGLKPTIVIHRGHSYYAPYTISQLQPSAKIIFMGSCGGYHLIHDILKISPDAHIIASKQTGKLDINQPFMNLLNEKLRNGNNIDWISFWKEFRTKTGKIDGFEDYIPPYKNLGALFIKAYKIAMGEVEEEE